MSLKEALRSLDLNGGHVYDADTDCTLSRDPWDELILTMDHGDDEVTETLQDLIEGPCNGCHGRELDIKINQVMSNFLHDMTMAKKEA